MIKKVIISTLGLFLILSCLLNIFLFTVFLESYRKQKRYQIDPSSYLQYHESNDKIRNKLRDIKRVVLFGDSRIAKWKPLPELSGCEFINRGISGETTSQSILRIEHDLISLNPDIAIIEIGVNDCNSIGILPDIENFITMKCKNNIHEIVTILNKNKIKTIFLTIFPVGLAYPHRWPIWSDKTKDAIKEINKFILLFSYTNTTVVNCDNIFLEGNNIKKKYAEDMLHLNSDGYIRLNDYLKPYLVKAVGDIELRD